MAEDGGIEIAPAQRRRRHAEGDQALGPEELVGEAGHHHRRYAGAQGRRAGAGAARMNHRGNALEQVVVGRRVDHQHVGAVLPRLQRTPPAQQHAAPPGTAQRRHDGPRQRLRIVHLETAEADAHRRRTGVQEPLQLLRHAPQVARGRKPIAGDVRPSRPVGRGRHDQRAEPVQVRRTLAAQLPADAAEAHRRQVELFAAHAIELASPRQPERLLGGEMAQQVVTAAETQPGRRHHAREPGGRRDRLQGCQERGNAALFGDVMGHHPQRSEHHRVRAGARRPGIARHVGNDRAPHLCQPAHEPQRVVARRQPVTTPHAAEQLHGIQRHRRVLEPVVEHEPPVVIVRGHAHGVARAGKSGTECAQGQYVPKGAKRYYADRHDRETIPFRCILTSR